MACNRRGPNGCACSSCEATDCLDSTSAVIEQLTFNIGTVPDPLIKWNIGATSVIKLSIDAWPSSVTKIFTRQSDCSWSTVSTVDVDYTVTEYSKNGTTSCPGSVVSTTTGTTTVSFNLGEILSSFTPWSLEVISGSIPSVGTISIQYTVAYNGNYPCGTTDLRADIGPTDLIEDPGTGNCSTQDVPLYAEVVAST